MDHQRSSDVEECQNCLRPDQALAPVQRVYVVPEAWDTAGSVTIDDAVEIWCFSCRSQYPHEPVPPAEG